MERDDQGDNTSAFPTFLDQDPYPTSRDGRPMSAASSNATSEFDPSKRQSDVLSITGPVGEPGLPPSRPTSNATTEQTWPRGGSSTRGSYTSPPSRRGMHVRDGSRPSSAKGQNHVPSLAAQGFFRPMSPQKLQAQRGQAVPPSTGSRVQSPVPTESLVEEDEPTLTYRFSNDSNASVNTEREVRGSTRDGNIPPLPSSRGLSIATSSGEDNGAGTASFMSKGSATPLTLRQAQDQQNLGTINATPPPKSPRSLRASLGLGSRHSSLRNAHDQKLSKSHERLHSSPSSPAVPTLEKPLSAAMASPSGTAKGKNYEYFAGNMLFFCSGRLLNTKATPLNVATFLLTALPGVLFFGFSAPWLWQHVSPALPILFGYIFFLTLSAFLHAAFSDPGILPRNLHPHPPNPEEVHDPLTVGPATTEWIMVKTFPSPRKQPDSQPNLEAGQNGPTTAMEVPTKYCKSCSIWRPPRAHHCRVCDACIETQDHHCVWLNNCVGRRNYRFFFAYVGFASVMAFFLLAFSIVHITFYGRDNNMSFANALSGRIEERMAFAMFIYSILALPYPGSLFFYHIFLVSRGESTREYLNSHKFLPKDRHRPFSQSSFIANWAAVLMRPRPPSYMSFKQRYIAGDTRFGHTMRRKDRKEIAKLDAARRNTRVDVMKKRYSVPTTSGSEPLHRNGAALEMKPLPPTPGNGTVAKSKRKKNPPGTLNSTPR